MTREWTETEIAAFVDGQLDDADMTRIAAIIDADPEARALADRLTRTDALLRDAFAAPMAEPPPEALTTAILAAPATVVPLPQRRRPAWIPTAIAAGVALVIGLVAGGILVGPEAPPAVAGLSIGAAPTDASAALETAPSGTVRAGLRPVASFEVAGGGICREFEALDRGGALTAAGVACRDPGGTWSVLFLAAITPDGRPAGHDYVPAAGIAADSLAAVLDALGAKAALTPDAEAARIAAGWR